jgi:hypothetical protein
LRDRDRWWWLIFLTGLAFGVGGVAIFYLGVRSIPTDNPYMTSADYWQLIGLWSFTLLICLGACVLFVAMAIHKRRQHRMRLAAFHGATSVMPVAEIHADPALAPDVTGKPLDLWWRTSTASRVIYVPLLGLQVVAVLLSIGAGIIGYLGPIFLPPQLQAYEVYASMPPQPMSVMEIVTRVAVAGVMVAILVVLGIILARVTPYLFGRPFGLTVTNAGISARTEWGSRIHVAWEEMRLLEVVKGDAQAPRRFALYAPGKRIDWAEYTMSLGGRYAPVDITSSEMTLRQASLLSLIAARSKFRPRTLAKTLESKPTPARVAPRSSIAAVLLVFALILGGITAADFYFAVTPVSWINWMSTGSLALATGGLLVASLWTALVRNTVPAYATPPTVGAPALDRSGVAYVFAWRTPAFSRLAQAFLGACLAINLAPGIWALLISFGLYWPGYQAQLLANGVFAALERYLLAVILGMCGVIGLALLYSATMMATTRIRADKDGLTTVRRRRQRLMAWSSVRDISWGAGGKGRFTYLVTSDPLVLPIFWPAGPQGESERTPTDGAAPIRADELAALVAARINKPIRVRHGE